ncbi:MAG: energy transducer TonB [Candidatus Scalindua sp.]|jgi:TonB family protein|nr:energy transducer TonB [Candidatus Scalindua sp.]MBT6052208.1 energy transducer TonB [Candidatus Scalindua sp.]MBT6227768.1 energy transducer TonB [Candidatus Scalindua sp.]MBT6564799.1 energy transducer TonB [Candidatus Scalindua sp.]MBT7213490.1 energy transducer TonB [Candidatus Scalindua sp.]
MMNGNVPFLISLLVSAIAHASLAFGVQHLHFSSAQVSLKPGNISRELAIHITFTDPLASSEENQKAKNVTKFNEGKTKPREENKSLIAKQEANDNLKPVKPDSYILMPDDEPVPERVLEETISNNEPELKTVSDRMSAQNFANPSGIKDKVVIPQAKNTQNVMVDLKSSLPYPDKSEKNSHVENGVLAQTKPGYINNPPPEYPRIARKREYTGKVTLKVEVKIDGNCGRVELVRSSGYSMLDNAATEAVKEWQFTPARKWGKAVSSFTEITVNFQLE